MLAGESSILVPLCDQTPSTWKAGWIPPLPSTCRYWWDAVECVWGKRWHDFSAETQISLSTYATKPLVSPQSHRNIQCFGLKGPQRPSSSSPPCPGQEEILLVLLKVPSILALDTIREGASNTSLGNLFQSLTNLPVKIFFFRFNVNVLSCSLKGLPLS